MKTWIFRGVALAMTLSTAQAMACPVGNQGDVQRPPKRPIVQTVSFQASELFERAQQLETAAASHERSAQASDRDAETLANRARILRSQAALVNVADRASARSPPRTARRSPTSGSRPGPSASARCSSSA